MYDKNPGSVFTDADIEQNALYRYGKHASDLRKLGICTHGWLQGPAKGTTGKTRCLDCGQEFDSLEAGMAAHDAAMNG